MNITCCIDSWLSDHYQFITNSIVNKNVLFFFLKNIFSVDSFIRLIVVFLCLVVLWKIKLIWTFLPQNKYRKCYIMSCNNNPYRVVVNFDWTLPFCRFFQTVSQKRVKSKFNVTWCCVSVIIFGTTYVNYIAYQLFHKWHL